MRIVPAPWHFSHLPPLTLKENRPDLYPFAFASGSREKSVRMGANRPTYVAGLERGVRPIGLWSMLITLSISSTPSIEPYAPSGSRVAPTRLERIG